MFPGGGELLLIFLIVLLLFGGKELPRIARMFGKWSSTMRRSLNEVKREFNRIGIDEEMKDAANLLKHNPNVGPKTPGQPNEPISARVPQEDVTEPGHTPSKPVEKPLKQKTGEEETPHPDSSDDTDSETRD